MASASYYSSSSLKLVASKLLRRSAIPYRPTASITCRSFNTNNGNGNAVPDDHDSRKTKDDHNINRHRLYDVINRFKTTRKLSRLFQRINYFPAKVIKPTRTEETADFLSYYIHMDEVGHEDVKVFVYHNSLLIEGEADDDFKATRGFKKYVCWIDLPDVDLADKKYKVRDIKADMEKKNKGELKLTIPKFKKEEMVFSVKVKSIELNNGR